MWIDSHSCWAISRLVLPTATSLAMRCSAVVSAAPGDDARAGARHSHRQPARRTRPRPDHPAAARRATPRRRHRLRVLARPRQHTQRRGPLRPGRRTSRPHPARPSPQRPRPAPAPARRIRPVERNSPHFTASSPPCRLCAACPWRVRYGRAAQNCQFWGRLSFAVFGGLQVAATTCPRRCGRPSPNRSASSPAGHVPRQAGRLQSSARSCGGIPLARHGRQWDGL